MNYDTGQWFPVSENPRLHEGTKSIIKISTQNDQFSRRRVQTQGTRKTFLEAKEEKISVTKNALVQKIKTSVATFIDNLAFKLVGKAYFNLINPINLLKVTGYKKE